MLWFMMEHKGSEILADWDACIFPSEHFKIVCISSSFIQ